MAEYKRAAKVGIISGLVWGAITATAFALYIESSFSTLVTYVNQQLITNANFTGGLSTNDFINQSLIQSVGLDIVLGVIGGIIIAIVFSSISNRFLPRIDLIPKAVIVSFFFFVLYQISLGPLDIIDIVGAIGATLVGGYLLGYLFDRSMPRPQLNNFDDGTSPMNPDGSSGSSPTQP